MIFVHQYLLLFEEQLAFCVAGLDQFENGIGGSITVSGAKLIRAPVSSSTVENMSLIVMPSYLTSTVAYRQSQPLESSMGVQSSSQYVLSEEVALSVVGLYSNSTFS